MKSFMFLVYFCLMVFGIPLKNFNEPVPNVQRSGVTDGLELLLTSRLPTGTEYSEAVLTSLDYVLQIEIPAERREFYTSARAYIVETLRLNIHQRVGRTAFAQQMRALGQLFNNEENPHRVRVVRILYERIIQSLGQHGVRAAINQPRPPVARAA